MSRRFYNEQQRGIRPSLVHLVAAGRSMGKWARLLLTSHTHALACMTLPRLLSQPPVFPACTAADRTHWQRHGPSRRGSRILQGRVSNPSESGTAPPPIILTHVTGTKQFLVVEETVGARRSYDIKSYVKSLT